VAPEPSEPELASVDPPLVASAAPPASVVTLEEGLELPAVEVVELPPAAGLLEDDGAVE